jgi:hypothetical protein
MLTPATIGASMPNDDGNTDDLDGFIGFVLSFA